MGSKPAPNPDIVRSNAGTFPATILVSPTCQLTSHRPKHGWIFPNDKTRIHPDDLDVVPTAFTWDPATNTYSIRRNP